MKHIHRADCLSGEFHIVRRWHFATAASCRAAFRRVTQAPWDGRCCNGPPRPFPRAA